MMCGEYRALAGAADTGGEYAEPSPGSSRCVPLLRWKTDVVEVGTGYL